MASSARVQKVADEVQKLLVVALRQKIRDARLQWVSITSVEMSKDLSYANVYYSILSLSEQVSKEDIEKALHKATGFFRTYLAKGLSLRVAPSVRFFYDDSTEYGNKMDELIAKARLDDKALIDESDQSIESQNVTTEQKDVQGKREQLR